MSEQANKTPLIDLLRNVPNDFRASWESQWAEDGTPTGHTMSPVGQLCHEAAERIEALEALLFHYVPTHQVRKQDREIMADIIQRHLNAALKEEEK